MSDQQPTHGTQPTGARPTAPAGPPVPDDRIHGDAFGDPWLRPTLATGTQQAEAAPAVDEAEPAPPAPARPLPPVGASWLVAGLGATLLLASVFGALSWDSITGGLWREGTQQAAYAMPSGGLTIIGGADDVTVVSGGAAGRIQVARHLAWGPGSSQPTVSEHLNGTTLELGSDCGGLFGWCGVDYVVTVPDASDVTVDNGSGDVSVTGSFGSAVLKTGSGDIDSTGLRAREVTAYAGSGDIALELGAVAPTVDVQTGSGDVSVKVPQDARYALSLDAGSGSEDVNVATDPTSSSSMQVRTGSGDIEVDYR